MMPRAAAARQTLHARFGRATLRGLLMLVLLYALVCALMYFRQDGLVFYPQPARAAPPPAPGRTVEPLVLAAADGVRLHGWFVSAAARSEGERAPLLIYFSGNAEEVSYLAGERRWPDDWALVFFNYRGYGASEGAPSEPHLLADAIAIYDEVLRRPDIDPARVAVMGRSLGTGVATFLAAARKVSRVILVSPYDSLVDVARSHYPWLPVDRLLRHRFDSAARAPSIAAPLLTIVAPADRTVPAARSLALVERWQGPRRVETIAEANHDNFGRFDAYWQAIRDFLRAERMR